MTEAVKKELESISDKKIVGSANKLRFKVFAIHFWGNRKTIDSDYIGEWVKRFNRGEEYIYADSERAKILIDRVDGITKARTRAKRQFTEAGWNKEYIEKRLRELGLA